jgi:hypothetical protein
VGPQLEHRLRIILHGEPSGRKRHDHDPKGRCVETPRSDVHDVPLILPFQALVDTFRNTTEELGNITTQYATSNKAAQLHRALTNSREAMSHVAT